MKKIINVYLIIDTLPSGNVYCNGEATLASPSPSRSVMYT